MRFAAVVIFVPLLTGCATKIVPSDMGGIDFASRGASELETNIGRNLFSLDVSDFNGDGLPDVVVGGDGSIMTWIGDGQGSFALSTSTPVSARVSSIAGRDVSNDGKPDVVATDEGGTPFKRTLHVFVGDGSGHFASPTDYAISGVVGGLALGQFSQSVAPDVLIALADVGGVSLFANNGGGTFSAASQVGGPGNPTSLAIGSGKTAFIAFGNATWPNAKGVAEYSYSSMALSSTWNNDLVGSFPNGLATGDFDGDHVLDPVFLTASADHQSPGPAEVIVAIGVGSKRAINQVAASGIVPIGPIAAADLNGDGKADLAVCGDGEPSSYPVLLLFGNGDGTFTAGPMLLVNSPPTAIVVADVDRDGRLDLVLGHPQSFGVLMGPGG